MSEQAVNGEKQPSEKPFPWRCPKCRQPAVKRVTMPYSCQRTDNGCVVTVKVPNLAVPRCSNCGEVVFDYAADEQIREAFLSQFDPLERGRKEPLDSAQNVPGGEARNSCQFLIGQWRFFLRHILVERHWTETLNHSTKLQTFEEVTGSVEFRDLMYGSHIHGEYRQDAQSAGHSLTVLLERMSNSGISLKATIAGSDTNRYCGVASFNEGSLFLDGVGIPLWEGDYLKEARIPLKPQVGRRPLSREDVCNARVVFHPLRPDVWILVVYHVFNNPGTRPTLLKSEVWHFREKPENNPASRKEPPEVVQEKNNTTRQIVDLEARLEEVESELERKRHDHEEATSELNDLKAEHEELEDDILDRELAWFGLNDAFRPTESDLEPLPFDGGKWQTSFSSFIDMIPELQELEDEIEDLQSEIDDLELESDTVEERLDQGYSEWVEEEYLKAEAIIEHAPSLPSLRKEELLSGDALACLSKDACRFLETYFFLYEGIYTKLPELEDLDCGPFVASMSKACERILADFLGPRCRTIYSDPTASSLLNDRKCTVDIPVEDQHYKIDNGSLRRVLGLLKGSGPICWSGLRNAAIALLLFGRKYRVGDGASKEIDNPLKLFGDEKERQELRLDLYRFQQLRNRFIHHESASWSQAQEVQRCFERCLRRLSWVLFGFSTA